MGESTLVHQKVRSSSSESMCYVDYHKEHAIQLNQYVGFAMSDKISQESDAVALHRNWEMPSTKKNKIESVARSAVLSVPGSDQASVEKFDLYVTENRLTTVGRVHGLPVFRLIDFESKNHCYLINERATSSEAQPSSVEFNIVDEYLIVSGRYDNSELEKYIVSLEIINCIVFRLAGIELTPKEVRLTAQLLIGLNLQSAAKADNVSVETKRSQIKSVISKLNVERQIDLVRILLPELSLLADVNSWDSEGQRLFNQYANRYLPDDVRCNRILDKSGKTVRIIDYGPVRGKPVIILHSMIFPDITNQDVEFALKNNLRLIWPIRPGILESTPAPKSVEHYSRETLGMLQRLQRYTHKKYQVSHLLPLVSVQENTRITLSISVAA